MMKRLYDRSFLAALASQTCFTLGNCLMVHYARWIEFLGGGVREIGWIMGGGAVLSLFLRPWMGQWIVRLGARKTWGFGYLVFAIGSIGNLAVENVDWWIYVMRTCYVLGGALVFASSLTYISQTAPRQRLAEAIGVLGAGGFIGMLVGPYLGDFILGATDERTRGDFMALFVTATVAVMLPLALLGFLRIPVGRQRSSSLKLRDFLHTVRVSWPGTILLVLAMFGLCMSVPFGFLASFVDGGGDGSQSRSTVSLFFLGYAGWGLVLRLWTRRVPDRIGRRRVLVLGILIFAVGMFSFVLVDHSRTWTILVPGVLCGTGHSLSFHTMTSLAIDGFPLERRGIGSALSLMALDAGLIGGAPVLGLIADTRGFPALFVVLGAVCLLTGAIYAWRSLRYARPLHVA